MKNEAIIEPKSRRGESDEVATEDQLHPPDENRKATDSTHDTPLAHPADEAEPRPGRLKHLLKRLALCLSIIACLATIASSISIPKIRTYYHNSRLFKALIHQSRQALHEDRDYREAIELLDKALAIKKNNKEAVNMMLIARANLAILTGEMKNVIGDVRTRVEITGDPFLKLILAKLYHSSNDLRNALKILLELDGKLKNEREVERLYHIATTRSRLGEIEDAEEEAQRCLELALSIKDLIGEISCKNALGWIYQDRELHDEAVKIFKENIEHLESLDAEPHDPTILVASYNGLATSLRLSGQFDEAVKAYKGGLWFAEAGGVRQSEARIKNNLGYLYFLMGRHDLASQHLKESLKTKNSIELKDTFFTLCNLCQNEARAGRLEDAAQFAAQAHMKVDRSLASHIFAFGLCLAELQYYQGQLLEAEESLARAEQALLDNKDLQKYNDDLQYLKRLFAQKPDSQRETRN